MNFISNLTCGQLFGIIIGAFVILVMLELFRRQTISTPWEIVTVRMIGNMIGYFIMAHGLSGLRLGRWMAVIWFMIGIGVVYIVNREIADYLKQKKDEKKQQRE